MTEKPIIFSGEMKKAIVTAGKVIVTVSMGAILAFLMMGSIAVPPDYEAATIEADEQPYNWQDTLIYVYDDYTPVPVETDAPELSTEKSTTQSTELSTQAVENAENVAEARTYNGIYEGDIIIGELTYYDVCEYCCGKLDGITASGYAISNGVQSYTASCNWLPFGAVIEVDGVEYTIRDRGGKRMNEVGRVDIFEPDGHESALTGGRRRGIEIKIIELP